MSCKETPRSFFIAIAIHMLHFLEGFFQRVDETIAGGFPSFDPEMFASPQEVVESKYYKAQWLLHIE